MRSKITGITGSPKYIYRSLISISVIRSNDRLSQPAGMTRVPQLRSWLPARLRGWTGWCNCMIFTILLDHLLVILRRHDRSPFPTIIRRLWNPQWWKMTKRGHEGPAAGSGGGDLCPYNMVPSPVASGFEYPTMGCYQEELNPMV